MTLLLACGLSVFTGIAQPLGSFAHDTLFLLDNAYRVFQGQIPSRDFSSAWGPVIFLIDACGLYLSNLNPAGLGYANALFGGLLAIWAFSIARFQGSSFWACALGIYTVLLIVAPFPIGGHPLDFGYAMIYNRYGFAFFGIIMIECAASAISTRHRFGGAVSTGVALGLLTFLKISYAFVAIPFVLILTVVSRRSDPRRFVGLGCGVLLVTLLVLCYDRFDLSDVLTDLEIAAAARQASLGLLHPIGIADWIQCTLILVYTADLVCGIGSGASARDRIVRLHGALFALGTLAAGYLLLISNQQPIVFPLNGYGAIVLLSAYRPFLTGRLTKWRGFSADFSSACLITVCVLPLGLENTVSVLGAASEPCWPQQPKSVALTSSDRGAFLHFRIYTGPFKTEVMGASYVDAIEDGMALLRRHTGDHDGVLTFDEFNPFNYLLDRPSPRGGLAAAASDYIFSDSAHPTVERFFGDTRYVMVRKYQQGLMEREDVDALMRIYGPTLRGHFLMVEETNHWALWRKADIQAGQNTR